MFTLKNEPLSKQQILEQGFALFKQTFWLAIPYSLSASLLIYGTQLILSLVSPSSLHQLDQNSEVIGIMVLCWLLGLVLLGGLIFRLYCFCYKIPSNFIQSIQQVLFKLIPLFMLGVLYSLIVLGGTMLFIIPGIILAVSLMFSFILIITDNQNVLQTLTTSHRLVWGNWWHTMMIISIPLSLNLALSLIAFIGVFGLFLHGGTTPLTQEQHIPVFILFIILIQTLYIPLIFSVALTLLHDLRRRALSSIFLRNYIH